MTYVIDCVETDAMRAAREKLHRSDDYKAFMAMPTVGGRLSVEAKAFWGGNKAVAVFRDELAEAMALRDSEKAAQA